MGPHGRQRARAVLGAWLVASVAIVALGPGVAPAVAGGAVFYVDGKHGDDANAGTSLAAPFKTVKAGLWALRYGGRLDVVGYDDYVYREQMTGSQWFINGSAASPIIIQAHGYPTGTRP
ncbi:MAG: hypothetical protein ACJ761_04315, partial [Chloroflexota bacterium]